MTVPPGTYALTVRGPAGSGFATSSCNRMATVTNGGTTSASCCLTGVPVVVTDGSTIVGENCPPPNNRIDPGETVSFSFCLKNIGAANTSNLIATLQATGGVTNPSNAQNYGTLVPGGATVCRSFTFTAGANCGETLTATLDLTDDTNTLGSVTFTYVLGTENVSFSENFDGVTAPALPSGWVSTFTNGASSCSGEDEGVCALGSNWTTQSATVDSAPNAAFHDDPDCVTDNNLDTPSFAITSAGALFSFRNNYKTEANFDGGVLEISSPNINGGAFTDVTAVAVGGTFISGGYNGTISTSFLSPIAGRKAWTGNSNGFVDTVINLGPNVVGQNVKVRFRLASDCSLSNDGWRVDGIRVVEGVSCCTGAPTPTPTPPAGTPTPTPTPTPAPPAQAINLSTRMRVLTGDAVGIGGFIITGNVPKRVLIRAIGPSLSRFGLDGFLLDPTVELHGTGMFAIISNDNWKDTNGPAIAATRIAPINDNESAILATLAPGAYTAIVAGKNGTTGLGLVEVYDLDPGAASQLGNISTRAFADTGSNLMIAGFILGNNTGVDHIIVRGLGPSLTAQGVTNPLPNPSIELRDGEGSLLASNNNWQDVPTEAVEIAAANLAPNNTNEAAISINLPPGAYTVLLTDQDGGIGNGLVEVYHLGAPIP